MFRHILCVLKGCPRLPLVSVQTGKCNLFSRIGAIHVAVAKAWLVIVLSGMMLTIRDFVWDFIHSDIADGHFVNSNDTEEEVGNRLLLQMINVC